MPQQPLRIVVIGGSAAGPKAAAKARRTDEFADITLIQRERDLSMASCGFPYYVGGTFDDRNLLICTPAGIVRDSTFYGKAKGIHARVETEALSIDRAAKTVTVKDIKTGQQDTLAYDRLVIATGASPVSPNVPGAELDGVQTLHSMGDADALRAIRDAKQVKKAVVVGGGLIGFEVCEALRLADIDTTVIEKTQQILPFLDPDLAKLVEIHIRANGPDIIVGNGVAEFLGEDGRLTGVKLDNGTELPCQLAVVAVGVRPNISLARAAGLEIGTQGGIQVNDYMQTSAPDIYAVGDCVECTSLITGGKVRAPYGDTANLQGRVAGQNLIEPESARFPGVTHTGICKIFDCTVGFTGLSEHAARDQGLTNIETVTISGVDIPPYMQGAIRDRLDELPADKDREIILYCKISLRGYESAAILQQHGWRNVKVMEGGLVAWPYAREK